MTSGDTVPGVPLVLYSKKKNYIDENKHRAFKQYMQSSRKFNRQPLLVWNTKSCIENERMQRGRQNKTFN